ncbi:signal-transduction protein containing cAMP-binding and CBS domains [Bacillus sp. JCM 19047]|nr:signal-transduction protein containing cAMP-binding and CBS domains [Bacillus sp. JCM 19047]
MSELMKQRLCEQEQRRNDAVQVALDKTIKELGEIPAPFAFFFMGSAGREEQLYQTDQDHGIIYDGEEACQRYFLFLGEEIVKALEDKGYERCTGGVMASNKAGVDPMRSGMNNLTFG